MITKELFIKMINSAEKFSAEIDRWNDFGIDVYDLPIGSIPWEMFTYWATSQFDEAGQDWIDWYLWERKDFSGNLLACYDEDGSKFFVNNPEDLWELVVSHILKHDLDCRCPHYNSETCTNS
jgi:hypothetical protein